VRELPAAAGGECGATHRLATVVMRKMYLQQRARRLLLLSKPCTGKHIRGFDGFKGRFE
jgi:hypothetical protein